MPDSTTAFRAGLIRFFHTFSIALIALLAITMSVLSLVAAFGGLPWLHINATFGATAIPDAGMYAQLAFTTFCVALAFYIPSNTRILQLERSHRRFRITMNDVARAYRLSHEQDRAGLFKTGSEFDSVRERIAMMREHPDLASLEPAVLEVAAQMSHEARELAEVYSGKKIERARMFLKQRQQEVDTLQENIRMAHLTTIQLKNWQLQVETEEGLVEKQLKRLEGDLAEILPGIGLKLGNTAGKAPQNVVRISGKPKRKPK
jgi:hypothetical protein